MYILVEFEKNPSDLSYQIEYREFLLQSPVLTQNTDYFIL